MHWYEEEPERGQVEPHRAGRQLCCVRPRAFTTLTIAATTALISPRAMSTRQMEKPPDT
jgi:hypothetical protein